MMIDKPVLILGGGINGAAVARELLLNGVPVCLVDTADLASGATAYSSRLIHGGLRYLEYGEFALVRESLAERSRLLRLAPQFVRPLRLFIPLRQRLGGLRKAALKFFGWGSANDSAAARGAWLVRMGLWMYDTFAKDSQLPKRSVHRTTDNDVPPVDRAKYRWLCSYYDAQIQHPERFVIALLEDARQLAAEHGVAFDVYTYHRTTLRDRTVEIYATDDSPVKMFEPSAIINATGAWVDHTLAKLQVASRRLMGGTKGSHFLTSHAGLRDALAGRGVYAEAPDGRPVFLLPMGDATLVGTTDLPYEESPETAVATENELTYLLDAANRVFAGLALTRGDVDLHYSGVRPLPYVGSANPAAVTRRHWVEENHESVVPLFSIIGGKLTTCRSLAEETVAAVLRRLGTQPTANSRDRVICGNELILPANDTLSDTSASCLLARHAIRNQWVTRLCDLVERRLMLLYDPKLSERCLRQLAGMMVEEGFLAESEIDDEVRLCRERLESHYGKRLTYE
jgi:glycerol-3-phosphate dehydrogenase